MNQSTKNKHIVGSFEFGLFNIHWSLTYNRPASYLSQSPHYFLVRCYEKKKI
jgi:hypothetical protein